MNFMRLGTRIAVIDNDGRILLSKRGDFGIWALPGGRVDSGELIQDSAIREVREETGLEVEIVRAVGLYYQQGRSRMNVLYQARPAGGELFASTDETLDNRFFAREDIPSDLFGQFYIDHAYSDETHLYTIKTPKLELLKIDLQLRWRWIQNFLSGRPEPKFTQFEIRAIGIIWHDGKIYTKNDELPSVKSDGKQSLPQALSKLVGKKLGWRWTGVRQTPVQDKLEFIFHTQVPDRMRESKWQLPDELDERQRILITKQDQIWHTHDN